MIDKCETKDILNKDYNKNEIRQKYEDVFLGKKDDTIIHTNLKDVINDIKNQSSYNDESTPLIKNFLNKFEQREKEISKSLQMINEKFNNFPKSNDIHVKENNNNPIIKKNIIKDDNVKSKQIKYLYIHKKNKSIESNLHKNNTFNNDHKISNQIISEFNLKKEYRFFLCKTRDRKLVDDLFEFVKIYKYTYQFIVTNKIYRRNSIYYIYFLYLENCNLLIQYLKKMEFLEKLTPEHGLEYIKHNSSLLYSYPHIDNLAYFKIQKIDNIDTKRKLYSVIQKSRCSSAETDVMTENSQTIRNKKSEELLRKKTKHESNISKDNNISKNIKKSKIEIKNEVKNGDISITSSKKHVVPKNNFRFVNNSKKSGNKKVKRLVKLKDKYVENEDISNHFSEEAKDKNNISTNNSETKSINKNDNFINKSEITNNLIKEESKKNKNKESIIENLTKINENFKNTNKEDSEKTIYKNFNEIKESKSNEKND